MIYDKCVINREPVDSENMEADEEAGQERKGEEEEKEKIINIWFISVVNVNGKREF